VGTEYVEGCGDGLAGGETDLADPDLVGEFAEEGGPVGAAGNLGGIGIEHEGGGLAAGRPSGPTTGGLRVERGVEPVGLTPEDPGIDERTNRGVTEYGDVGKAGDPGQEGVRVVAFSLEVFEVAVIEGLVPKLDDELVGCGASSEESG